MAIICRGENSLLLLFVTLHAASTVSSLATTTERHNDVTGGYHGSREAAEDHGMPDEQRLLRRLLRSYDPGIRPELSVGPFHRPKPNPWVNPTHGQLCIRPVLNVSRSIVVNFSLTLVQIMDMVSPAI